MTGLTRILTLLDAYADCARLPETEFLGIGLVPVPSFQVPCCRPLSNLKRPVKYEGSHRVHPTYSDVSYYSRGSIYCHLDEAMRRLL